MIAVLAFLLLADGGAGGTGARLVLLGIVLGSVFLHEVAHAAAARALGLRVGGIYLHLVPFAYVERGRPAQELAVALAGPAASLMAGLACLGIGGAVLSSAFPWLAFHRWLEQPLWMATGVNLLMGMGNLIPALPADGGRALRAFLLMRLPPGTARSLTARVGTFVGVLLLLLAVVIGTWPDAAAVALLGVFVIMIAWREAHAPRGAR